MAQKKPVRSLDSLSSLLSDKQKLAFKLEEEKRNQQLKKALDVTKALIPGLEKKKLPDTEFNKKYDELKLSKAEILTGTDKDGDYIIHKNLKYIRGEETKTPIK